jgi:hypothetical protein
VTKRNASCKAAGAGAAFFENLAGLSRDYGSTERMPPLQLLRLFDAGDVDLAAPRPAQWLLRNVAPHLSQLHGFDAFYDAYATAAA